MLFFCFRLAVSTHSRAEAAADKPRGFQADFASFNTQPRGGGCKPPVKKVHKSPVFQHTAARRRLPRVDICEPPPLDCFNTQPRGGGCQANTTIVKSNLEFQHTAARRRLQHFCLYFPYLKTFQHTAARRRLHGKNHTTKQMQ